MSDSAIKVEHVSKEYRLGMIGRTTLKADLQRMWAKMRGKEDPCSKIGADQSHIGEKFLALDDVSFEVKQGETLGIIGHNGAGKSTLLKLLSRITGPTKGKISFNGRIASMLEVGTGFHGELTGRENVYMNGAILGMTSAEITRKFDEIVEFSEMGQFIDTPVKRYSSGMYVKLAFAVAAHLDAEIMIMDEVLAVGDVKFQQKCLRHLGDISQKEGRTILFVSHNMGAVSRLCSRGLLLNHGRNIFEGETSACIQHYLSMAETQNSKYTAAEKQELPFQITGAFMCDEQGQEKFSFSTGQALCFSLELAAHKAVGSELVSLRLYDMKKSAVFTIEFPLSEFLQGASARKALIRFKACSLTAGLYSWRLCVYLPRAASYQKLDGVCNFAVYDTSTVFSSRPAGSYGVILVDYEIDGRAVPQDGNG